VADGPVRIWVQRFLTFQFVCLGWVFFNASGLSNAFAVLGRVSRAGGGPPRWSPPAGAGGRRHVVSQLVPSVRVDRLQATFSRQRSAVQVGVLAVLLLGITTFGPVGVAPFIYYRF
jgi:alginate O-acetyltransferase complex protein AlgI